MLIEIRSTLKNKRANLQNFCLNNRFLQFINPYLTQKPVSAGFCPTYKIQGSMIRATTAAFLPKQSPHKSFLFAVSLPLFANGRSVNNAEFC